MACKQCWLARILVVSFLFICAMGSAAQMPQPSASTADSVQWTVPLEKRVRVIIDSDAANESDDQAAISYALLSPTIMVRGMVAAHFRPHAGSHIKSAAESMEASYQEMHALLRLLKVEGCFPVRRGSTTPFADATATGASEGADLIIEEAMRDDRRPLYVLFLGPLTNLAAAYKKNPAISTRLIAIWIGGGAHPNGGEEYNQDGDRVAAHIIMQSDIRLWQIPKPAYRLARFGLAELSQKVGRRGELGRFLFDRVRTFMYSFPPLTEFFQYSDLPAVAVVLQQPWIGDFEDRAAPAIGADGYYKPGREGRTIRALRSYDHRATLEDFFAKLAAYADGELKPSCIQPPPKP